MTAPPVYAIADAESLAPRPLPDAVAAMAATGVGWIQLRAKALPDDELFRQAEACSEAVAGSGAALWVDDRADVAALCGAAGVHLGQGDLPPEAARLVVGEGVRIGRSTHHEAQVEEADRDPQVDVIAFGPVFATGSKKDPEPVVGLDGLRRARRLTGKPLVAIGGIDAERLAAVLEAGADTAAMIGAVCSGDVTANCRRLLEIAARAGC